MYNTFKPEQAMGLMDFVRAAKSCVKEISPQTLLEKLSAREDLLLIDVREQGEYEAGHIKGALLVPRGTIEAAADPAYPKHLPELAAARDRGNRQLAPRPRLSGSAAASRAGRGVPLTSDKWGQTPLVFRFFLEAAVEFNGV